MRSITLFVVTLLLSAAACAQPLWEVQNPSPLRLNALDVQCFDSSTAYVLTTDGYFMKTTDRGSTWDKKLIGYTNTITSFSFTAKDTGYVAGDGGLILKTTDAGVTWQHINIGVTGLIRDIAFANTQLGYVLYDYGLYTTADGGNAWSYQGLPCPTQGYCYDHIIQKNKYVVLVGSIEILASRDSGRTWSSWSSNYTSGATSIPGSDSIFIVVGSDGGSGGSIVKVIFDDSVSFQSVGYNNADGHQRAFRGVGFSNRDTGFIVGDGGIMFKTTDNSFTWNYDSVSVENQLSHISFGTGGWGTCVGDGVILSTTNSGENWINITPAAVTTNLSDVSFFNAKIGTAVGDSGTILHTTNGGVQWIRQNANISEHLSKVAQIDSLNAMAVGDSGIIIRTSDGGMSWGRILDTILLHITALQFRNDKQGIALSDSGIILLSSDGGYIWKRYTFNYGSNAEVLYASDSLLFSCCSPTMRSVDGGKTWKAFTESLYHDGYMPEYGISTIALDENLNLYLSGYGYWGTIPHYQGHESISLYKSVDSGSTWKYYYDSTWDYFPGMPYPGPHMIKIGFVYGSTCIAFDNTRQMYVGTGGSAWLVGASPVPYQMNALSTPDDSTFYAVGNNGSIIKLKSIQIPTAVQENAVPPMFFTLSQNYPNPTTASSTTINYFLEKASSVSLKVYTLLGEQVAVPVAGWQTAGMHSVALDCSHLSQGVYFYTLSQGGITQTKMMIVRR